MGCSSAAAVLKNASADIANPVTHSALDFFEAPSVLVTYDGSHDQEYFPQNGCSGPTLEFVLGGGDNRNFIDLNCIQLGLQVAIYDQTGKQKLDSDDAHTVIFANNTLHSLFSQCELFLNGVLVAESNNTYHHRAFIETEVTTNETSKNTWTACQGYTYDPTPQLVVKSPWILRRIADTLTNEYTEHLYGTLYVDFFTCEKLLLPDITVRIKLYRSSNDFCLMSCADDSATTFCAVIERASLFVRKIQVTESTKLSIERALLKSPARYPYIETLCKSFIIQSGQNVFVREAIFGTEPIRRITLCMVTNANFKGVKDTNPFHYSSFGLNKIELLRGGGMPIGGTPVDISNKTRLYHNTLAALGFGNSSNGIKLSEFDNHFILVFDLTPSHEASKSLTLFPQLTGTPLTLKLSFATALTEAVELYMLGEKFSQIFVDSCRNISKNHSIFT